jgi:hypothetical protein
MTVLRLLGALAFVAALSAAADAGETRTMLGVSVTVTYNCAMDLSKLTAEQRKVVEDYCLKQRAQPAPQPGGK